MSIQLPPSSAVPTNPVPLQKRTPEQLRDGLKVDLYEGSLDKKADLDRLDILTVGRLIDDASNYLANKAGVKVSLDRVVLNDKEADAMNAVAWAEFHDNGKGEFHLGPLATQDLIKGVQALRNKPIEKWNVSDQTQFGEAASAVLHEIAHVTLPSYSEKSIKSYNATRQTGIEEATAELTALGRMSEFYQREFHQTTPDPSKKILDSTTSYTTYTGRFSDLARMAGNTSPEAIADAAQTIGDATEVKQRFATLAQAIADNLGKGNEMPKVFVTEVAKTIPRYISELPSARIRLQTLLGPMADIGAGNKVDVQDVLDRLKDIDDTTPKPKKPHVAKQSTRFFS